MPARDAKTREGWSVFAGTASFNGGNGTPPNSLDKVWAACSYRPTMKLASLLLLISASLCAASEKPNILFLFADDHAFSALGHVSGEVETPHLDRLAAEGTSFTRAYNSGAWGGAVCVASRAMLMTGRQLWFAEAEQKQTKKLYEEAGKSWPQLMAGAGYETYMTGKWHVKMSAEKIFGTARNVRPGMPKTVKESYLRPVEGEKDQWDPADKSIGGFWQGGKHWSEVEADTAVEYLGAAKESDKPFFMYIAFNAPHDPRQAPQDYLDMYPVNRMPLPENYAAEYPYRDPMGAPHSLRDEKLAPMPRTEFAVKTHRSEYYAIITHMDAQIGRVLKALDESGKSDNTYVVFSADHGLGVGRHGLFGKQNMYDHSVRVPWIVRGPGVGNGKKIEAPIYLQDVMPTTLELAGIEKPDHVSFDSLMPVVDGTPQDKNKAIYGIVPPKMD